MIASSWFIVRICHDARSHARKIHYPVQNNPPLELEESSPYPLKLSYVHFIIITISLYLGLPNSGIKIFLKTAQFNVHEKREHFSYIPRKLLAQKASS
jgi:hypothetical protein